MAGTIACLPAQIEELTEVVFEFDRGNAIPEGENDLRSRAIFHPAHVAHNRTNFVRGHTVQTNSLDGIHADTGQI